MTDWLEKTVTKSLLSALGKPASTAGIAVGDVLQFREKPAAAPPPVVLPPPVVQPPPVVVQPPPVVVQPPPPVSDTAQLFVCRMGVRMEPFRPVPFPDWGLQSSTTFEYAAFDQDPKWQALLYGCDVDRTKLEIVNGQLVTTIADGPTASRHANGWTGNNYAALVLLPKLTPQPLDAVQHFSFAVDPHLTGRRWVEVVAYEAGLPLRYPNETRNSPARHATGQGQYLAWVIDGTGHQFSVTVPGPVGERVDQTVGIDWSWGPTSDRFRQEWPNVGRNGDGSISRDRLNGTQELLGPAHLRRFDLWISRTHWRLEEGGHLIKQGAFAVPLALQRVQWGLIHMLYHSSLEAQELAQHAPHETRFLGDLKGQDVRHWDDFVISREERLPG